MDQLPRFGKRELICLLSFACNYVVFVWRGFLFLWVLGMGYIILLWHSLSLPYNYLEKVKCLKETSEARPSSKDPVEPVARKPDKVTAFWASTRPVQDLRRLQREDANIGPIVTAMESGKGPSGQEMVTCSPACRHYWILWDSLV